MKLVFSWVHDSDFIFPLCNSDSPCKGGVSAVSRLLMDDGGRRYLSTIPWIDEGIRLIVAVQNLEMKHADWSRESWSATIENNLAKIYSLLDESYFEVMGSHELMLILVAWKEFLSFGVQVGMQKEIEI